MDKYKPGRLDEVLGGAELVRGMTGWLRDWDEVHLRKTKKVGSR